MTRQKTYYFIRPLNKKADESIVEFLEEMGSGEKASLKDIKGSTLSLICAQAWKDVKYLLDSKKSNEWLQFDVYARRGNAGPAIKWPFGLKKKKTTEEKRVKEKLNKLKGKSKLPK
jgi:hypothetical protein